MSLLYFLLVCVVLVLGLTIIQALLFAKDFRFLLRGPQTLERLHVRRLNEFHNTAEELIAKVEEE